MRIGYARVSTSEQSLDLQLDALEAAGCDQIFKDHGASGATTQRTEYAELMRTLSEGDTLVVWRLDRLARSVFDLIDTLHAMKNRGIAFQSLCEGMDTSSPYGEAIYAIASAFAHLERSLIIERTKAGMEAAKARGVKFGRRPALNGEELREALYLKSKGMKVSAIACQLGVSQATIYRRFSDVKSLRELCRKRASAQNLANNNSIKCAEL